MKFSDILALAKQGYTPADIRELLSMQTEEVQQETEQAEPTEQAQAMPKEAEPTNAPAETAQSAGEAVSGNADKINELEQEIARLKAENTRIAQPAKERAKTSQEILTDLARGFM